MLILIFINKMIKNLTNIWTTFNFFFFFFEPSLDFNDMLKRFQINIFEFQKVEIYII